MLKKLILDNWLDVLNCLVFMKLYEMKISCVNDSISIKYLNTMILIKINDKHIGIFYSESKAKQNKKIYDEVYYIDCYEDIEDDGRYEVYCMDVFDLYDIDNNMICSWSYTNDCRIIYFMRFRIDDEHNFVVNPNFTTDKESNRDAYTEINITNSKNDEIETTFALIDENFRLCQIDIASANQIIIFEDRDNKKIGTHYQSRRNSLWKIINVYSFIKE